MDRNLSPVTTTKQAWTERHRRDAATDLLLRAVLLIQDDSPSVYAELVALIAIDVLKNEDPEAEYRDGLGECGATPEAIEAAVVRILDAELPVDSVAGRIDAYRFKTECDAEALPTGHKVQIARLAGRIDATMFVLALLGPVSRKVKL